MIDVVLIVLTAVSLGLSFVLKRPVQCVDKTVPAAVVQPEAK